MNQFIHQKQQLRILVGTPAGNGVVSLQYMLSMMEIFQKVTQIKHQIFIRDNLRIAKERGVINVQQLQQLDQLEAANMIDFEIGLYTLSNESLLGRGRNHIAAVAIRQGWDKLFFIDADARFTFDQFIRIATSPHDIVAGVCPLKVLPISLNYLPFQDDEFYHKENLRSLESMVAMANGHKSNYLKVAYVGTAFMCLTRKLLIQCAEDTNEYQYPNPATGHNHTHWDMFDTKPMHNKFMSEDWSMCERARRLGHDVYIDANVVISHVGNMVFSPDLASIKQVTNQKGFFSDSIGKVAANT